MTKDIEKLITLVLRDAEDRAINAGYNGAMDDGGAGRLREQVEFYRAGQNGAIPGQWQHYLTKLDPEWEEYQRLKRKFGGK